MNRTITIVGKGPSAVHAQDWIDQCPETDVCSINQAAMILRPDQPVRFAFFCHRYMAEAMQPLWGRIETFVSPNSLIDSCCLPNGFPRHKHVVYQGNACGASRDQLLERIHAGHPAHHHTVTAAMTWLAKIGYRRFRLIGFGGEGYAPAFAGQPRDMGRDWREVEDTVAAIINDLYGATVERFGE